MSGELPKAALKAIFVTASGLPAHLVVWDGDPWPFVGPVGGIIYGVLSLNLTTDVQQGELDEDHGTYDAPTHSVHTTRIARTRVTITARFDDFDAATEAYDMCAKVRRRIGYPLARAGLRVQGFSLVKAREVRNLGHAPDNKVLPQAILEMAFHRLITEDITPELGKSDGTDGWIEFAVPLTRSGNVP